MSDKVMRGIIYFFFIGYMFLGVSIGLFFYVFGLIIAWFYSSFFSCRPIHVKHRGELKIVNIISSIRELSSLSGYLLFSFEGYHKHGTNRGRQAGRIAADKGQSPDME